MYCQKCGKQLLEESKFCADCGTNVSGSDKLPVTSIKRLTNYILDRILGGIAFLLFIIATWGLISVLAKTFSFEGSIFVKIINLIVPVLMVFSFYMNPFYYLFCEGIWGRSIGKWITKTKVVRMDGEKPKFLQILGRSFARIIPFEAFSFLVSNNPIGWHDHLSKTLVVPSDYTVDDIKNINFTEAKNSKNNATLVVIAIIFGAFMLISTIGILSSVVLASLSSARDKALDASIKANMSSLKVDSVLFQDKNNSYNNFCNEQKTLDILKASSKSAKGNKQDYVCNNDAENWMASSPLKGGGYYCIDSTTGEPTKLDVKPGTQISCTSTNNTIVDTSNTPSTSNTSSSLTELMKKGFTDSCVNKSTNYAFCSCSFDGIVKKLGVDGFIEMSKTYSSTGKMDPEVSNIISGCSSFLNN